MNDDARRQKQTTGVVDQSLPHEVGRLIRDVDALRLRPIDVSAAKKFQYSE